MRITLILIYAGLLLSCSSGSESTSTSEKNDSLKVVKPVLVTDAVKYDTDDPAIWIDRKDPSQSLIIGTDKGGDAGDGALYVFDLKGKEVREKTVRDLKRPNNVDIAYGLIMGDDSVDIAVCTERNTNSIRVFSLPDMTSIDGGGIPVFEGDTARSPMGIALYTSPEGNVYTIISRKSGPDRSYLWQYLLTVRGSKVTGELVRKFGRYSGKHEIESIAVDNELGYVYYSDENAGIRKYYAHPDSSNTELAFFGTTGFKENHEGISIYKTDSLHGYIIVSDQQANQFQLFRREGSETGKHDHTLVKIIKVSTIESDGNDVCSIPLPGFPDGLFVAMSEDKTFQYYKWEDLIEYSVNPLSHSLTR